MDRDAGPFLMQRHALGLAGIICLIGSAAMFAFNMANDDFALIASALLRVGIVFCLTWLAFPQLEKLSKYLPKWAWGLLAVSACLVIINPKTFPIALVSIAFVAIFSFTGWLFKPPKK